MWTLRHLILLNLFLELCGPAFTQSLAQNPDKAAPPDKAPGATEREKALAAAVTTSMQWPPTDPRVAKSYQDLVLQTIRRWRSGDGNPLLQRNINRRHRPLEGQDRPDRGLSGI